MTRSYFHTPMKLGGWLGVTALGVLAALASIFWGRNTLTLSEVISVFSAEPDPGVSFILLEDLLPRVFVGSLAGVGLGLSGALFQRWLKNPLASPDVIGVGYGAAVAAITYMILFGGSGPGMSLAAIGGGLAVAVVIYLLAGQSGAVGPKLIVSGVALGAMLQALIQYLLTRTDVRTAGDAMRWLTGSLAPSNWDRFILLAVGVGAASLLLPIVLRQLGTLELGDDVAASLGLNVRRARWLLILTAVTLGAVPVAVTGPLSFVAFLAGPLSAMVSGGRINVLLAGACGGSLVLVANYVAANFFAQIQLPAGVVTGAFGAPFLMWVLLRMNTSAAGRRL